MSLVTIGGQRVVASGSFIVPIGSNEAVLNLPIGQVTIRLSQTAPTSQIRPTGPASADIELQKMDHMGEAYFDGGVGGLKFAINASARVSHLGTYFEVAYAVTAPDAP